ncbi:MAG: glutathione S-transferase family protein [Burkholderiales bacterium]
MTEIILHHYPMSPFAEKIRLIMGYKKLQWNSVIISPIMPKPDVIALTGGYRKTPVLQIGADIYCDTQLIARVLDEIKYSPTLFPARSAIASTAAAAWADRQLFFASVMIASQPEGAKVLFGHMSEAEMNAFREDRAAFRKGPAQRPSLNEARLLLLNTLQQMESQFESGVKFIMGDGPCIADFSYYHCLWFTLRAGPAADILDRYPRVHDWLGRMKALGHGESQDMSSTDAIAVAHNAEPMAEGTVAVELPEGIALGDMVSVAPGDYGQDPSTGKLALARLDEIGIRRHDERAGTVVVHFPRAGYQMTKVEA